MKDWLVISVVIFVTGTGGFILGRHSSVPVPDSRPPERVVGRSLLGTGIPTREATAAEVSAARRAMFKVEETVIYSEENLERDLQMLGRGATPIARLESLTRLLGNLSPENLPQVLAAFKNIPPTAEYLNEYQMLLYAWTKFDRAGAIKFAEELAGNGVGGELGLTQEELLKPVLASWASENPKQALAWFDYLPKEQQTHHLKMSLMSGWASNNLQEAVEYLQTLPPDQNREYLAGQLASHMYKQNPQEAAKWAEGIADPKLKEQIFEELAEDWVSVDPKGLASWLANHTQHSYAWEAVEDLGRGWVATDSESATDWFESLPDGPAKQRGIHRMVESWADNDLLSMGEWLNGLPDSSTTDRGVRAYADRLLELAPEAAIDSAMAIKSDGLRNETVHKLAQEWYSQDADAAIGWANQNSYPADALERTLEAYGEINQQELNEVTKMINRDQVSPERMLELRETQTILQEQASQLKKLASE